MGREISGLLYRVLWVEYRILVSNPGPTIWCCRIAVGATVKENIVLWYVRRRRVAADSAGHVVQQEGDVERCKTWSEGGPKILVASVSLAHSSRAETK